MREVSYDETKALLEGIVKGREDFVYVPVDGYRCVNWTEDDEGRTPSCIVGHVFAKLGVLGELRVGFKGWDAHGTTDMLAQFGVAWFDPSAVRLLARVQSKQDDGATWGLALGEAINEIEDN